MRPSRSLVASRFVKSHSPASLCVPSTSFFENEGDRFPDLGACVRHVTHLHQLFPLEALFDCLPEIIFFVKDREGRFVCVNETLLANSGRASKAEVLGHTDRDFFPEVLAKAHMEQDRMVMESGEPIRDCLELVRNRENKIGWHLTYKFPLRDEDGNVIGMTGVCRNLHSPAEKAAPYPSLAKVIQHIHQHFAGPLRISELADVAGISKGALERTFKKVISLTLVQYIQKVRIEHAVHLLVETELGLSEIAQKCGYYDQSTFTKKFKEYTKLTPGEFRRMKRGAKA